MQLSVRLVTCPRPGTWPRILVTIIIVIVTAATWAGYGPPGVIALFVGSGMAAGLGPTRRVLLPAREP